MADSPNSSKRRIWHISRGAEKVNVCELCEEQPVSVLCAECCKCYCDECNKIIHGIKPRKRHKVETIPGDVVVNARCPLHSDALRMFCVDKVKMCCGICKAKKLHKSHNITYLTDVSKTTRHSQLLR